jgi:hypothetical protein
MNRLFQSCFQLLAVMAIFGHSPTSRADAPSNEKTSAETYLIQYHIKQIRPMGKDVEDGPLLVVKEGVRLDARFGNAISPRRGAQLAEPLRDGVQFIASIMRKDGQRFLDAKVEVPDFVSNKEKSTRAVLRTYRVVEAIELGKTITLSSPSSKDELLEITVQLYLDELQDKPKEISKEQAIKIIEINMRENNTTLRPEDYEIDAFQDSEENWLVTVWRLPKVPGGHTVYVLSKEGAIQKVHRGA